MPLRVFLSKKKTPHHAPLLGTGSEAPYRDTKKMPLLFSKTSPSDSWVIRGKLKTKGKKKAPVIIVVCYGKVIRGV